MHCSHIYNMNINTHKYNFIKYTILDIAAQSIYMFIYTFTLLKMTFSRRLWIALWIERSNFI